jgi:hypothetical protein
MEGFIGNATAKRNNMEDFKILDIGLGSFYGTPGISEDDI